MPPIIIRPLGYSAIITLLFSLACSRAESEMPPKPAEAKPVTTPNEADRPQPPEQPAASAKSGVHASVPVTEVLLFQSTYDTSKVGYPGTGENTRTLSKDNYKDFDALIAKVLDRTLYNDEVTLAQYIALQLAGNQAEVDRIDALGPVDHGQPSGSGSYSSFTLKNGDDVVYTFRDDRKAYSGVWIQRLRELVANPNHKLYSGKGPAQKLYGMMELRWAAKSYSDQFEFRRTKQSKWLFKLLASEGDYGGRPEDAEAIDVRVDEVLIMPGGTPSLDAQAAALTEALIGFNRSMRKLIGYCIANKPSEDDATAKALWGQASAEHAHFLPLLRSFEASLRQVHTEYFAQCKSKSKAGSFAHQACQVLLDAQELVDTHESGHDTSALRTTYLASLAKIAPSTECETALVKEATTLAQVLDTMKDVPYYNVVNLRLVESYVACQP